MSLVSLFARLQTAAVQVKDDFLCQLLRFEQSPKHTTLPVMQLHFCNNAVKKQRPLFCLLCVRVWNSKDD